MTLIDERDVAYEQEKKRKIFKTLITAIVVLIIIAIILLIFVKIRNSSKLKLNVDGKEISNIESTLILKDEKGKIVEENGQIFLSVRDVSNLLSRQYYNSEYKKKGEDKTKCQIRNENEYSSYISGSNVFYKAIVTENDGLVQNTNNQLTEFETIPEKNTVDYEYFTLNSDTKYVNDIIYADASAIELGFNVIISYDSSKKTITISSLDYLEGLAKGIRNDVVDSAEYDYINKRLFKYGMCIVKDEDGNLGVGSYTNRDKITSYVASCKYSSIKFNEATKTLSVITSDDNKDGILLIDLENQEITKNMTSQYDEIKSIDNNFEYFLVKNEDKYGIMDSNGMVIIEPSFEEIGVNDGKYTDVSNKYILNSKYIPVKQNGLWGLYDISGNKLIDPKYPEFGCALAQSGESVTVVPNVQGSADAVVFLYNKEKSLYGLYNAQTGETIAISLVEVFKKVEDGNYYINYVINRDNSVVHTLNVYTDL